MGSCCSNGNQVQVHDDDVVTQPTSPKSQTNNATETTSPKKTNLSTTSGVPRSKNSTKTNSNSDQIERQPSGLRIDTSPEQQEITIRIIQARNLPNKDIVGKTDAFVAVTAGGQQYQTTVVKNNLNPIWNSDVILSGVDLFKQIRDLKFEVFDWDRVGRDFIGQFEIHFPTDLREIETPALWYSLVDEKGNDVPNAEVQVQLQIRADTSVVSARNYTHVLQLEVISGSNLHNMDWLENGHEPYVSISIGKTMFRTTTTKAISNRKDPTWNETLFLFINSDIQKEWRLVIQCVDKDLHKNDHIGTGYLKIKDIYESDNKTFEGDIDLQSRIVNLDKGLGSLPDEEKSDGCGSIKIKATLIRRLNIEEQFYENLLDEFDTNKNGQLDKEEIKQMLVYLEIEQDIESFMKRFDDYDDTLSREEVLKMLRDSKFQESPDAPKFIMNHLRRTQELDPFSVKLMEGLYRGPLQEASARKTLEVRHRKTGITVNEHIPGYIQFAFRLMYKNKAGKLLSGTDTAQNILLKMSVDKGKQFDKPESVKTIPKFVDTFNLDLSILENDDIDDFKTFNDFFARAIRFEEIRPMTDIDTDIVSCADCRMVVFNNVYESTRFWIKGDKFSLETVLGPRAEIAPIFEGGAFCISRLAPQDYHRWHWPCGGTITNITPIDGSLYAVNPIVINRNVNVFSENKRCVIEMDTDHFGKMVMVPISAALVGSYLLFQDSKNRLKVGDYVKRGEVSGEFRYGGSTVLTFFEAGKVEWKEDLLACTDDKIETLIEVRDTIGGLPGKTNISDMVRQTS